MQALCATKQKSSPWQRQFTRHLTHTHSKPTHTRNVFLWRRSPTICFPTHAHSVRSHTRYVQFRRRNTSRNGGEPVSAELSSQTRAFSHNCHICANCLPFALLLLFPFTQKTALSSLISSVSSLVFCVREPCLRSTSDCAVLLATAWRTKRSGIMSERHLSM